MWDVGCEIERVNEVTGKAKHPVSGIQNPAPNIQHFEFLLFRILLLTILPFRFSPIKG